MTESQEEAAWGPTDIPILLSKGDGGLGELERGAQFTCCAGTNVRMLTPAALRGRERAREREGEAQKRKEKREGGKGGGEGEGGGRGEE